MLFQGTRRYMLVDLLGRGYKIAELLDDMESFLYVTIYYAVRLLCSTCRGMPSWLHRYFDEYIEHQGEFYCGFKKE